MPGPGKHTAESLFACSALIFRAPTHRSPRRRPCSRTRLQRPSDALHPFSRSSAAQRAAEEVIIVILLDKKSMFTSGRSRHTDGRKHPGRGATDRQKAAMTSSGDKSKSGSRASSRLLSPRAGKSVTVGSQQELEVLGVASPTFFGKPRLLDLEGAVKAARRVASDHWTWPLVPPPSPHLLDCDDLGD